MKTTQTTPFIRIPNYIITLSNTKDKYILPLYIYSAINTNPYNSNIVDTNLIHISETFSPSNASSPSKFAASFKTLSDESQEEFSCPLQLICSPLCPSNSHSNPQLSKTSRLQYIFLDRDTQMDSQWTKLTYDEYYYLISAVESNNSSNTSPNNKMNLIELLNLYLYYKQKIQLYTYTQTKLQSQHNNPFIKVSMHESLDTICKNTSLSRNTLTKYTNQLVSLKMISVNQTTQTTQSPNNHKQPTNKYQLSTAWKTIGQNN